MKFTLHRRKWGSLPFAALIPGVPPESLGALSGEGVK